MTWYYSGGAANADPDASLGGVKSSEVAGESLNDLFDDVGGAESEAGDVEYRCVYYQNETGGTLEDVRVYIPSQPSGDDSFKVGKDLAGKNATADVIADEDTAPDPAVTFATAADYDNGIVLGDMDDDDYFAIWVERTVPSAATAGTSSWTIRARGEVAS
jgi:hypothetical protein